MHEQNLHSTVWKSWTRLEKKNLGCFAIQLYWLSFDFISCHFAVMISFKSFCLLTDFVAWTFVVIHVLFYVAGNYRFGAVTRNRILILEVDEIQGSDFFITFRSRTFNILRVISQSNLYLQVIQWRFFTVRNFDGTIFK